MHRSFKNLVIKISLCSSVLLGAVSFAHADGKAMVYIHNFSETETTTLLSNGTNPFDLHTQKLPSGREVLSAGAETRFEAELQGRLQDAAHHAAAVAKLDALANDPAAAEKLFGQGYTVVKLNKPPRDVWDDYRDSKDGLFAATNASLRARTEGGFTALNYKPGTRVDFDNGMTHRIEAGINIKPFSNGKPTAGQLKLFADANASYNPLREFAKQYPGRNVEEVFEPSVEINQKRTMYELQLNGVKHGEISVDMVNYRDPVDHTKAGTFYRVEMEGDHLNANPTAKQIASSAAAPHNGKDTLDPDNDNNPDIIELHRLNDVLVGVLDAKPAGQAKVTEARMNLGKPIAKLARDRGALRPSLAKVAAAKGPIKSSH